MPDPPSAPSLPDFKAIFPNTVAAVASTVSNVGGFYWSADQDFDFGPAAGKKSRPSEAANPYARPFAVSPRSPEPSNGGEPHPGTPGAFAAAAAVAAVGVALLNPVIALYTRLVKQRLLKNEVRRRLYEHVRSNPGAGSAEAARAVAVHITTAKRHLMVLHKFDFVTGIHTRAGPRYFENHGRFPTETAHDLLLLRRPENGEFLRALARTPGMGLSEIARSAGVAKSTASRRAGILLSARLIEKKDRGFVVTTRALDALLIRVCDMSVRPPALRQGLRSSA
jgi:predicted transcriptional regulator